MNYSQSRSHGTIIILLAHKLFGMRSKLQIYPPAGAGLHVWGGHQQVIPFTSCHTSHQDCSLEADTRLVSTNHYLDLNRQHVLQVSPWEQSAEDPVYNDANWRVWALLCKMQQYNPQGVRGTLITDGWDLFFF